MVTEKEKEQEGCVIRALESAFGARATEEEWELRFRLLRDQQEVATNLLANWGDISHSPEEVEMMRKKSFLLNHRILEGILDKIPAHDTPLGRAMRRYNRENRVLNYPQLIPVVLRRGHIVLVTWHSAKQPGHMAHLGWAGKLVMLSDNRAPLPQFQNKRSFVTRIYTPKNST